MDFSGSPLCVCLTFIYLNFPSLICNGPSQDDCIGKEPVIDPPILVVKYGDPATATCYSRYRATRIGWEGPMGGAHGENTQQLVWSVPSVTDWSLAKGVVCTVYNYTNHDYEAMAWTMNDGEDTECQIHLPIMIYKTPESVTISFVNHTDPPDEAEEEGYRLQCEVESVAPANKLTTIWYRGDTELGRTSFPHLNQTNAVTLRTYLNVTAVPKEDNGVPYSCVARLDLNTMETIPDIRSNSIQLSSGNLNITIIIVIGLAVAALALVLTLGVAVVMWKKPCKRNESH